MSYQFKPDNSDARDLYKNDQILQISGNIKMLNRLLVRNVPTNLSIPPFQNNKSEN